MEGFIIDNQGGGSSSRNVQQLLDPSDSDNKSSPASSGGAGPSSSNQRPRGRPPGSKNKPKPPIVVTRDSPNALRSHVLEVSAGTDIIESLNNYAMRRGRGVVVFNANGAVSNVTIRQPASSSGSVVLRGAFQILSLIGTVLPPPAPPGAGGLSIFLSGGQGQVVGGNIIGPLIATERVILVTASFANAVFERLPAEDQAAEENTGQQVHAAVSPSSDVTGSGGSLPLFNVAPPPAQATYAFSADLSGWGASNAASRPPF
ncbi:AT-hook motif nuclear-localized protein 27 [Apium graveolens]|uniref:AT-hook motif nuclear-localized protein 27 n=1 Tax=Apium graveolens TaxID=4045 RepID=UPI003D7AB85F